MKRFLRTLLCGYLGHRDHWYPEGPVRLGIWYHWVCLRCGLRTDVFGS